MFWKDKTVLVIGGAGFVGSHLVEALLKSGAVVRVLDDLSRGTNKIDGAIYYYGDSSLQFTCSDVITGYDEKKPMDFVFNLAATVAGVEYNQTHNASMFDENTKLQTTPLNSLVEYMRNGVDVGRLVQVSSVCVYSPGYNNPCYEEHGLLEAPTKANEGYAWSKRVGEMYVNWCHEQYGLDAVIVRPSNIYGPRDYFDDKAHVIPALIKKAFEDDVVKVNGTGKEKREFIYVTDVVKGMMATAINGRSGEAYNIGTGGRTCTSIKGLIYKILACDDLTRGKTCKFVSDFDPGDSIRWSNAEKALVDLGWTSRVSLEEGLIETVNWYKENILCK